MAEDLINRIAASLQHVRVGIFYFTTNFVNQTLFLSIQSVSLFTLGGIFMAGFYVAGLNNGGDKYYGGFCGKTDKLYR